MTRKRFYLGQDGSLCAAEEESRWCGWYWTLRTRWMRLTHQVAPSLDKDAELAEATEAARRDIQNHIEVCDQCRAWFEQCEAAGQRAPDQAREPLPEPAQEKALFVN